MSAGPGSRSTAAPAAPHGVRSERGAPSGSIVIRWLGPDGLRRIDLGAMPVEAAARALDLPAVSPVVVDAGDSGAQLTGALLEALDRAAQSRCCRQQVDRDGINLFLDLPETDVWPTELPSLLLGGGDAAAFGAPPITALDRERAVARIGAALGLDRSATIARYPQDVRALGAALRRAESELARLDRGLRRRVDVSRRCAALAGGGLIAAFGGTLTQARWLLVAGAVCFTAGALGLAALRRTLATQRRARQRIETRISHFRERLQALEREAREIAAVVGLGDPWDLAARLEESPLLRGLGVDTGPVLERARRLAPEFGIDPAAVERPEAWRAGELLPGGWPSEVRSRAGEQRTARSVVAAARLLERSRALPPGWPLVVWQPWAADDAATRASALWALTAAAGRPVLVVI